MLSASSNEANLSSIMHTEIEQADSRRRHILVGPQKYCFDESIRMTGTKLNFYLKINPPFSLPDKSSIR